ncbi:MAG: hypothetical protein Q8L97_05185 [Nitrosomonas sp.]|nr:hypothetical protein [Nitrosomonas sp.]MDP1549539.1 hypothetical protein [Nitrosomonas sp.]
MQTREERDTMGVVEGARRSIMGRANAALVAEFQEIKLHRGLNSYSFC